MSPEFAYLDSEIEVRALVSRVLPVGAFVPLDEALREIRKVHPRVRIAPEVLLRVLETHSIMALRLEAPK